MDAADNTIYSGHFAFACPFAGIVGCYSRRNFAGGSGGAFEEGFAGGILHFLILQYHHHLNSTLQRSEFFAILCLFVSLAWLLWDFIFFPKAAASDLLDSSQRSS